LKLGTACTLAVLTFLISACRDATTTPEVTAQELDSLTCRQWRALDSVTKHAFAEKAHVTIRTGLGGIVREVGGTPPPHIKPTPAEVERLTRRISRACQRETDRKVYDVAVELDDYLPSDAIGYAKAMPSRYGEMDCEIWFFEMSEIERMIAASELLNAARSVDGLNPNDSDALETRFAQEIERDCYALYLPGADLRTIASVVYGRTHTYRQ
jgi:hypothetical protein